MGLLQLLLTTHMAKSMFELCQSFADFSVFLNLSQRSPTTIMGNPMGIVSIELNGGVMNSG
jgi:hypothetical protein